MRWVRAFPYHLPDRKSYIVDGMEKWFHDDYDYTGLGELGEDICLIEWDIAADKLMRNEFEWHAEIWREEDPNKVLVAPHLLFEGRPQAVWAHRHVQADGREDWIQPRDTEADYFAFGLIYLPNHLVREFEASDPKTRGTPIGIKPDHYEDYRFTDQTFSVWYTRMGYGPAYVTWDVVPVHLNEGKWP